MAIKKLQNDFTTPEQSKRLLELGVPADSANCYYTQEEIEGNMYWFDLHIKREYQPHTSLHASTIYGDTLPCWSVGRLLDIYLLSVEMETNIKPNAIFFLGDNKSLMENLMEWFETESFDFSKLED